MKKDANTRCKVDGAGVYGEEGTSYTRKGVRRKKGEKLVESESGERN